MACTTGCPTPGAHKSWGECMREKRTRVAWAASASGLDKTMQDKWDANLDAYDAARDQGIQPASTRMSDVRKAVEISDRTGSAYDAGASRELSL